MSNLENESFLSQKSDTPNHLTEQELLVWASIESFEYFSTYEQFLESAFFKKYYDLWEEVIKVPWMWGIENQQQVKIISGHAGKESVSFLWGNIPQNIRDQKVQRILIAFGYLTRRDFDASNSGEWEQKDETDISYFGILWPYDERMIKEFQKDEHIDQDGIIWPETKKRLYRKVYKLFHQITKDEVTEKWLVDLKSELPESWE